MLKAGSVELEFDGEPIRQLIVVGGRRPDHAWLSSFVSDNCLETAGVDAGIAACRAAGIVPTTILGDMDSVPGQDLEWARGGGARCDLYDRAKDETDTQIALRTFGDGPIAATGCFGGRFDHLESIVDAFASSRRDPSCMIDHCEGIFFLKPSIGSSRVSLRSSSRVIAVSLLSMTDECEGVSITGARWPLDCVTLRRDDQWAISNEPVGAQTVASCSRGVLAVYWCLDESAKR